MRESNVTVPEEQSLFNMNLALLQRIDKILTLIAQAKLTGKVSEQYACLYTLIGELFYKLNEEEKKELTKLFDDIGKMNKKLYSKVPDKQLIDLMFKAENFMKECMDKRGMLGTNKDERGL